jgi:hypothetical protein
MFTCGRLPAAVAVSRVLAVMIGGCGGGGGGTAVTSPGLIASATPGTAPAPGRMQRAAGPWT